MQNSTANNASKREPLATGRVFQKTSGDAEFTKIEYLDWREKIMYLIDKKLAGVTAVAVALGVCLSQPAKANDALSYIQDYFGGVNNSINYSDAQRMAALDDDRAELDSRVNAAVSSGRITSSQAADLRAQLRNNRVVQLGLARDGRFSFSDNQRIANSLTSIGASVQNAIATHVMVPRPGSGFAPRGFVARRQVDELQNQISIRINNGKRNGNLTRSEFETLRNELAAIDARKQEMMNSRGFLSFSENQRLLSRLNRLQDQVRVEMHDSQIAGRNYPWY